MLWPKEQLDELYKEIKENAVRGSCSVLLLVALDCDALCATRILTVRLLAPRPVLLPKYDDARVAGANMQTLFRCDNIAYKIKPVSGYSDVTRVNAELIDPNEEVRALARDAAWRRPAHPLVAPIDSCAQ